MNCQELLKILELDKFDIKWDIDLFQLALTHSSYSIDKSMGKLANNERLEFYGDSVLKLACSKYLYESFPNEREGILSSYRSMLVSDAFLAMYAEEINLKKFLRVSNRPDLKTKKAQDVLCACAFEAILGVIYIQSNMDIIHNFLRKYFEKYLPYVEQNLKKLNAKATLQEFTQAKNKKLPEYILEDAFGVDHKKEFVVVVKYNNKIVGKGQGFSKKEAEQAAAFDACKKLGVINE